MHEPSLFEVLRRTLRSMNSRFLNHALGNDEVAGEGGRGGGARALWLKLVRLMLKPNPIPKPYSSKGPDQSIFVSLKQSSAWEISE